MELQAKKSLGQHFLKSESVLKSIIQSSNISQGEKVLEIGPGTGVLTEQLLNAGAFVCAVEKDHRAAEIIREKYGKNEDRIQIIEQDILEFNREEHGFEAGKYAVIANIPYYITGAILEMFLEHPPRPNRMVLLVQKEVADRIIGEKSGNSIKESILSISVKVFGTPKIVCKVPRGAFVPPPNVDSAVIEITAISDNKFIENGITQEKISDFFKIVRAGFAHKRKYLAKNLESVATKEKIAAAWENNQLDPKTRAENITPDQWLNIASALL